MGENGRVAGETKRVSLRASGSRGGRIQGEEGEQGEQGEQGADPVHKSNLILNVCMR